MPGIEFLELFNRSDSLNDLAPLVAAEIESGDLTLLKLVEVLCSWLTNPDKDKRVQGVSLLAEVLKLLPSGLLTEKECVFMVTFFCDRLRDHYSVIPYALAGLASLSAMDNFSDDSSTEEIISKLQENITCQALTQHQRNNFYTIMQNLLIKKGGKISTNHTLILYALIPGMDSESDPRNLLFLFSFLPKVFSKMPLSDLKFLSEEAFAVLECYFPIDFTPVEEKGNITREDLASSLENCFAANPAFAEYCIPMICDKMESSLKIAQLDSLSLVISGFKNWDIELANPFTNRLWFSIKDVLIPGNDQEVSLLAGKALIAILTAYSTAVLSENETKTLTFLFEDISSSAHGYLSNPSLSLFLPTLRLLSDVIAVSSTTAGFMLPKVLPQLLALLETNIEQRDVILRALTPILLSAVKFNCWKNESCVDHLNKVLPIVTKSIEDEKCRGSGFACLTALVSKLPEDVRVSLYEAIPKIVCTESFQSSSEDFAKFIRSLSEEYITEIENHLIGAFKIPEEFTAKEVKNYLEVLTWTIGVPQLTEAASTVILNYIIMDDHALHRNDAVFVLRDFVGKTDVEVLKYLGSECRFPEKLLNSYFDATDRREDEVESVAAIVTRIIRVLDAKEQTSLLTAGLELLNRNIGVNGTPSNQLVLLEGLACGLQKDVKIENPVKLCESLVKYSFSATTDASKTSAARLLAVFINKMNDENEVDTVLTSAKLKIQTNTCTSSVRLSAWIAKSLILRGYYPACDDWLVELLNLVVNPVYGMDAAESVRLLLEECPFLSEVNHCKVGLLYKQRIFQKIGLLIPEDRKPSKAASIALAYILKYSPTSLVLGTIGELTGVMVHCLGSDDSSVILAILEILCSLLESRVDILRTLAETFIPKCILLGQTSSHMGVRQQALDCIYLYGKYSTVDMLPYKTKVLTGLQKCLDDKKRLVRQSAVKARTRWFLV